MVYGGITEELLMRQFLVSLGAWLLGTAAVTPLTPILVWRALVLNGVAGIAFGYLYWRNGLEAAMPGHMIAHLLMQAPGVILLQRML